jgi:hypothetical protein
MLLKASYGRSFGWVDRVRGILLGTSNNAAICDFSAPPERSAYEVEFGLAATGPFFALSA